MWQSVQDLCHDERTLTCMSKELVNTTITSTFAGCGVSEQIHHNGQTFTQKKTREVYLKLCSTVGAAYYGGGFSCSICGRVSVARPIVGYLKANRASRGRWLPQHNYRTNCSLPIPGVRFQPSLVIRNRTCGWTTVPRCSTRWWTCLNSNAQRPMPCLRRICCGWGNRWDGDGGVEIVV